MFFVKCHYKCVKFALSISDRYNCKFDNAKPLRNRKYSGSEFCCR